MNCKKHRYLCVLALSPILNLADAKISDPHSLINNTNAAQTETVPQDAKEFLLAAAQVNGLEAPGLQPWRILVTFDKFDEDGDNVDSGTVVAAIYFRDMTGYSDWPIWLQMIVMVPHGVLLYVAVWFWWPKSKEESRRFFFVFAYLVTFYLTMHYAFHFSFTAATR